ncbi:hypothetical protein HELRODRAFT_78679, partial [Helobdella robusta]|uniref:SRR1-like domain-containing protein n=1 Tax=Helobdella robusta TaxID=6412 RepID=T1G3E5_HELRO
IPKPSCHIYDPSFSACDLDVLKYFNFSIIQQNEECKRTVTRPTLFYMPHCGRPMYNNVLSSNWDKDRLGHVCILGNSFLSIMNK